jgi:hypothetical protein
MHLIFTAGRWGTIKKERKKERKCASLVLIGNRDQDQQSILIG